LFVRSPPSAKQARLRRIDGAHGEVIQLTKVVTTLGRPGAGFVTFIRRGDQFAVRFTDGVDSARLNGAALTEAPVILKAGDILEVQGARLEFQLAEA
jgi:RNase P/RNase MRP subunit p29